MTFQVGDCVKFYDDENGEDYTGTISETGKDFDPRVRITWDDGLQSLMLPGNLERIC